MIYPNQKNMAEKMFSAWAQEAGDDSKFTSNTLIAQPQSGKTGVQEQLMVLINHRQNQKFGGSKSRNICLQGASDRQLTNQTTSRFSKNSMVEDYLLGHKTYHTPDLKQNSKSYKNIFSSTNNNSKLFISKSNKEKISIFLDEAHVGIGYDQLLESFFDSHFGGFPGTPQYTGEYFVAITATPATFLYYNKHKLNTTKIRPFKNWYFKPGQGYLGFKDMRHRMEWAYPLDTDEQRKDFISGPINKFISGKSGYFILRVSAGDSKIIEDLENMKSSVFDVEVYKSSKKNIKRLITDIHTPTLKHKVCIIIDSYLQGKTFELDTESDEYINLPIKCTPKEYVRGWFDRVNETANESFTIQSVGRNCGYGIANQDYPIYCNIDHIDKAIKFYELAEQELWDEVENYFPSSTHTSMATYEQNDWIGPNIFNDIKVAKQNYPNSKIHVVNVSQYSQDKDIAMDIIKGNAGATARAKTEVAIMVADDQSPYHPDSWKELENKYQNVKGKAFVFIKSANKQEISKVFDTSVFMGEYPIQEG